jgi:hypothetical protein
MIGVYSLHIIRQNVSCWKLWWWLVVVVVVVVAVVVEVEEEEEEEEKAHQLMTLGLVIVTLMILSRFQCNMCTTRNS